MLHNLLGKIVCDKYAMQPEDIIKYDSYVQGSTH